VGLLAGENDHEAVARTGEGRAVNRHDYTEAEIEAALDRSLVRSLLELVRLRREHPAFAGEMEVAVEDASLLCLSWFRRSTVVELMVDVTTGEMGITSQPANPSGAADVQPSACLLGPNGTLTDCEEASSCA
jgi:hypothetical protein